MVNETIFFLQLAAVFAFLAGAVRLGQAALTVLIALSGVLANLFVVKQVVLFGMQVTCSDVFIVAGILGLNLLQEIYGREAAGKAVRASFLALLLFAALSAIHLLYLPSPADATQKAFETILSPAPRIAVASLAVCYAVQRIDVALFGRLRNWILPFAPRVLVSLLLSQALDTVLFSVFGLYGLVESLFDIIVLSYAIKVVVIFSASAAASALKRFSKAKEEVSA